MNTAINKTGTTKSSNFSSVNSKLPTIGGISLAEVAVLGAAGFVLWRNRAKIQTLLEDNNINVPSFLSSDLSDLIQSGVSLIANKESKSSTATSSRSRRHDA
jgi:hypothetical protein